MNEAHHFVVVTFATTPEDQARALEEIGAYVAGFLSRQPGFVTSRLLASCDGQSIVHQAEWLDEGSFRTAGALAREHPDLPKLLVYQPRGVGCRLARTF